MAQQIVSERSSLYVQRVHDFFRRYHAAAERDVALSQAFNEIALLLDALQGLEQELARSHDEHKDAYAALDSQCQYLTQLFEAAPAIYLMLRLDGTLRRVNEVGRQLLQCEERALIGRALTYFVAEGQRRAVQQLITSMPQQNNVLYTTIDIQPPGGAIVAITFAVVVARSPLGRAQELRLIGHPTAELAASSSSLRG
ncbi:hypothetical protein HC891_18470 [Candidatus Gracilibacteria bacterium]|nr:hypothetical protein [Candidatus Gracilibacteria bacterium]